MRRVVVTGMGIWSSIGQDLQTVTESLREGRSGIIFDPKRLETGLHSGLVGNVPRPDLKAFLARKYRVTMSEDAEYAYMAARQALESADIYGDYLRLNEEGIVWGNDGNSCSIESAEIMAKEKNSLMVGPHAAFKNMTSSAIMNLATIFHLRGISINVAAACASSSHAIGLATLLIRNGMQQIVLVGGSAETSSYGSMSVDAVRAISLRNDSPSQACRPFDEDHDGMIQSGGAAALVLEEYEHAVARGAIILAEVAGYGFSNSGTEEISMANNEAEYIAMSRALADAKIKATEVDYVNAHATSTPQGDREEAIALTRLFGGSHTWVSSTKSMTGHEDWMSGASEAIYSILMMHNNFIAPNINLEHVIEEAKTLKIPTKALRMPVNVVLSNSLGMGGTNSALILRKI